MPVELGGAPLCVVCDKRVYYSEQKTCMNKTWHKQCFKCIECKKTLEIPTANMTEGGLYCNQCYKKVQAVVPSRDVGNGGQSEYVNTEDVDCCPRCGRRVYFAEQQLGQGRKWHKSCFTCAACKKKVDSVTHADHQGELYCCPCHGRLFGPKGYGFAGGAGTGLSTETFNPEELSTDVPLVAKAYIAPVVASGNKTVSNGEEVPGQETCARCANQVFLAERKQAAGKVYHVACFNCVMCKKKLDANLTEKDGDIYCKVCYGRHFGPKGYGFGVGSGVLQMN